MFQRDKWPFTPECLSEIIDSETLAVIQSGCCERLKNALTILDCMPGTGGFCHRIESIDEEQRYAEFCRLLRDDNHVLGGNELCKNWDIEQAKKSLEEFKKTGNPYRVFKCHMKLTDTTYIIQIRNKPVAIVFSGQYRPSDGISEINERVQKLDNTHDAEIVLDIGVQQQLLEEAKILRPQPNDFETRLRREVEHIQRIAESEYRQKKYLWEQEFLDTLRITDMHDSNPSLARLRQNMRTMLARIVDFCHCTYAVFFVNIQKGDTVLPAIATTGISDDILDILPHFNWKKAGFPVEGFDASLWDIVQGLDSAKNNGFRGEHSKYLMNASCILPTTLGDKYRGVLVLGSFFEQVDLRDERRFLRELANIVGSYALIELEMYHLDQEHHRWKSTATLLTHQLRTALTPITTQIGRAKHLANILPANTTSQQIKEILIRAEDLGLEIAKGAQKTLKGHVLQVEPEDFEFERYPLSVLIANSVEGFIPEAEKRHRQLIIDKSVETLPEAKVDVARLTIAFSNLIENAIKYSYPETKIFVHAHYTTLIDTDYPSATIEIDDLGDEIRLEDREQIFEEGTRALTKAKMSLIPGSGLGLWETRAVVEAHGGKIEVTCQRTSIKKHQGIAYQVVFGVTIPLPKKH